jgi:TP53 regulating kinase-like protein
MIIGHGAEAVLRKQGSAVVKERVAKGYRLPALDTKLRKQRTRREASILARLQELNFPAPRVQAKDEKNMTLTLSFIDGSTVKDVLHTDPVALSKDIGRKVGILHANDIVHADLTTSNMLVTDEVGFIDFGLSFVSKKAEDKAVDLHLLDRALESKHHDIYSECITAVRAGYAEGNPCAADVFARLETVQKRGRNKKK